MLTRQEIEALFPDGVGQVEDASDPDDQGISLPAPVALVARSSGYDGSLFEPEP